jgi:hypothetical protein
MGSAPGSSSKLPVNTRKYAWWTPSPIWTASMKGSISSLTLEELNAVRFLKLKRGY